MISYYRLEICPIVIYVLRFVLYLNQLSERVCDSFNSKLPPSVETCDCK